MNDPDQKKTAKTHDYPQPPWEMSGRGVVRAFATPIGALDLPRGFHPVHVAGWSVGVLAYVEYRPPSVLSYRELLWMPAAVKAFDREGRAHYGYFVSRIYVDDERGLQGGRDLWRLPKTMARFAPREGGVEMSADDGTEMELEFGHSGPAVKVGSHVATLQPERAGLVRFRADFSAFAAIARLRVMRFAGDSAAWRPWLQRRNLPLPAVALTTFASTMQAPDRRPRTDDAVVTPPRASA